MTTELTLGELAEFAAEAVAKSDQLKLAVVAHLLNRRLGDA